LGDLALHLAAGEAGRPAREVPRIARELVHRAPGALDDDVEMARGLGDGRRTVGLLCTVAHVGDASRPGLGRRPAGPRRPTGGPWTPTAPSLRERPASSSGAFPPARRGSRVAARR